MQLSSRRLLPTIPAITTGVSLRQSVVTSANATDGDFPFQARDPSCFLILLSSGDGRLINPGGRAGGRSPIGYDGSELSCDFALQPSCQLAIMVAPPALLTLTVLMSYRIEQRLAVLAFAACWPHHPSRFVQSRRCGELIAMLSCCPTPGYAPTAAPPRGSEYPASLNTSRSVVGNHLVRADSICARSAESRALLPNAGNRRF